MSSNQELTSGANTSTMGLGLVLGVGVWVVSYQMQYSGKGGTASVGAISSFFKPQNASGALDKKYGTVTSLYLPNYVNLTNTDPNIITHCGTDIFPCTQRTELLFSATCNISSGTVLIDKDKCFFNAVRIA